MKVYVEVILKTTTNRLRQDGLGVMSGAVGDGIIIGVLAISICLTPSCDGSALIARRINCHYPSLFYLKLYSKEAFHFLTPHNPIYGMYTYTYLTNSHI